MHIMKVHWSHPVNSTGVEQECYHVLLQAEKISDLLELFKSWSTHIASFCLPSSVHHRVLIVFPAQFLKNYAY